MLLEKFLKKKREHKIDFKFNKIIWDNRFEINYKNNYELFLKKKLGNSFFIDQLKQSGWEKILLKNNKFKELEIPNKIILSLPAVKNKKNDVLYVPHLKYYSNIKSKKEFSNMGFLFKPVKLLPNIY